MNQLTLDLQENELQDKYLQARELVIRFINGDENVAKDALNWLGNRAEENQHVGTHYEVQRSSNIIRLSLYESDEYPLVVEFKDRSKYAYDAHEVTYVLPDKTQETKTARDIFDMLVQEDVDAVGPDGKMASVGHLFHHLIKRTDNKVDPIRHKRIL